MYLLYRYTEILSSGYDDFCPKNCGLNMKYLKKNYVQSFKDADVISAEVPMPNMKPVN